MKDAVLRCLNIAYTIVHSRWTQGPVNYDNIPMLGSILRAHMEIVLRPMSQNKASIAITAILHPVCWNRVLLSMNEVVDLGMELVSSQIRSCVDGPLDQELLDLFPLSSSCLEMVVEIIDYSNSYLPADPGTDPAWNIKTWNTAIGMVKDIKYVLLEMYPYAAGRYIHHKCSTGGRILPSHTCRLAVESLQKVRYCEPDRARLAVGVVVFDRYSWLLQTEESSLPACSWVPNDPSTFFRNVVETLQNHGRVKNTSMQGGKHIRHTDLSLRMKSRSKAFGNPNLVVKQWMEEQLNVVSQICMAVTDFSVLAAKGSLLDISGEPFLHSIFMHVMMSMLDLADVLDRVETPEWIWSRSCNLDLVRDFYTKSMSNQNALEHICIVGAHSIRLEATRFVDLMAGGIWRWSAGGEPRAKISEDWRSMLHHLAISVQAAGGDNMHSYYLPTSSDAASRLLRRTMRKDATCGEEQDAGPEVPARGKEIPADLDEIVKMINGSNTECASAGKKSRNGRRKQAKKDRQKASERLPETGEVHDEEQETECAICMEGPITHCVMGCNHAIYCERCALAAEVEWQEMCPMCRRSTASQPWHAIPIEEAKKMGLCIFWP